MDVAETFTHFFVSEDSCNLGAFSVQIWPKKSCYVNFIDKIHVYICSRGFQKNQQIVDLVFYYPEFHISVDHALIRQNKR